MAQMNLKIITPEKITLNETIDKVVVPSKDGELGILPHHINLMAAIAPGELKITKGSRTDSYAVGEGLLQIQDNQITILTDLARTPAEIDEKAVEEARKRAEQALQQDLSDEEYATTLAIIEKSLVQLRVKRRHRG